MRFQQATSATAKFELKAGYTLVSRTVRWSRFNGVLQRTEGPSNTMVASTSVKFGVVGASN
jgi:hypothetical protein